MGTTVSAELLILLSDLEERRKRKGTGWCRKHGVGARRRALSSMLNVVALSSPEGAASAEARRQAAEILTGVCRACGGCKMARK